MHLSPPLIVLVILAAMVAGTVWLAPVQRDLGQATVMLPAATYKTLALLAKEQVSANGRPLTVAQIIEQLTSGWEQGSSCQEI